ncbi:type VI secretion system protein ImpL [Andreprevotia lacus DSM 23236]|jgi:type VI secretion system protein ImpL|uniref:Type VI secretion system protein ImpL n=1 Tax=Andreprevotia lacus DSM 23236 TaxID=1121001 RepID=A0A1W1XH09_9NEIS|nr:type VI secretion protein IcmF/TssM N-terminal domain-containing protein [Andreprevotia lacus]SMC22808.1 type VI secretion system protein ImpL [Andreprevotia lacus DSM 23236]
MKKVLVFLFWLAVLILLAAACWGVALWNDWPAWGALFLFFGIIGLWFLGKLIWRLIGGWRERSRTATPVEKPEPVVSAESALKAKWKEAIALLRRSNLRRLGNPLYVLPWYMVIGRSGSGKTTALTRARLSSPLKKVSATAQVETTLNVDWWYFDKAVVLDTAGRYIAPEEVDGDRKEWDKMLDFLGHYRSKEGLNGLVLTIQADRLLDPEADALAEEGRVIRMRIEQLIRLFDKRFPVYVLVTKCDQLYGMETWSQLLPEGMLDQAMGYVGTEAMLGKLDEAGFVDAAFDHVGARLKRLQLAIMQRLDSADPGLLLFPSEFARLQGSLKTFLRHALGDSPYLEEPFLRGVFFSSGLQQGGAMSSLLKDIAPREPEHAPAYKGMFLHDLFDRVLPADRYLLRPAALVNHWRRATRHLGLTTWLLFNVAVLSYLVFSFAHSTNTLSQMRDMYPEKLVLTGQLKHDVESLEKFRGFAYWLEQRDARFASRYLAFDGKVVEVEGKIKANYVAKFRKYILPGLDEAFSNKVNALVRMGQSEQLADYIQTLVRRINLVQARLNDANHEDLRKMPALSGSVLFEMDPNMSPEAASHFNDMYVALLAWQPNDLFRQQRLAALRNDLNQIALNSDDLQWIVDWTDAQSDLKKVQLADFWRGTRKVAGSPEISPAFTRDGKARIDAFMAEVRKSAPNPATFDEKLAHFNQWYEQEKLRAWRDFAWNFPQGEDLLNGENEWRGAVVRLTGNESAYNQLMNRLVSEFKDADATKLPSWLQLNLRLFSVRNRSTQQAAIKAPGAINDIGGKLLKSIGSGGSVGNAKAELDAQFAAMNVYQGYSAALAKAVNDSTVAAAKATQTAADFHSFDNDPAVKSSLQDAYAKLAELRRTLGGAQAEDQVAWGLLAGPLQLAVRYADTQASCVLQKEWESKVMWPMQSAAGMPEMLDQLYGDNGTVWAFLNGPAKPFVRRGSEAYDSVQTLGQSVPFNADFLPFINGAVGQQVGQKVAKQQQVNADKRAELDIQQQKQALQEQEKQAEARAADLKKTADNLRLGAYPIKVTGLPTGVNDGAKANVIGTLLTVQCASAPFNLNNLNFSVSEAFYWSQQTCGDTTLKIRLPSFTITRKYSGPQGFVAFLQEFQNGARVFDASEFPTDKARLDAVNVRQITVRYQFSGEELALKNVRQLATVEEEAAKALQQKQEAKAALNTLDQQAFQSKMQGLSPNAAPLSVQLPGRIGQCWNPDAKLRTPEKPPRKVIDELVNAALASAPVAKPVPTPAPVVAPTPVPQRSGHLVTGPVPDQLVALKAAYAGAERWLPGDGRFTLQIWLADSQGAAETALKRLGAELGADKLIAYPTVAYGKSVIAIAYGDLANGSDAAKARSSLSSTLLSHGPMTRTSHGIRAELVQQKLYQ